MKSLLTSLLLFFSSISSSFVGNKLNPVNLSNVTPTPNIQMCFIGSSTTAFKLTENYCQLANMQINQERIIDGDKVTAIIASLQDQINNIDNPPKSSEGATLSDNVNAIISSYPNADHDIAAYEDKMTAMQEMATMLGNALQAQLNYRNKLEQQLAFYQNYLDNMPIGTGNGACSSHEGVNPAAGRGNIGQVICNDGWTGSSVYYFNVDECVAYYIKHNMAN